MTMVAFSGDLSRLTPEATMLQCVDVQSGVRFVEDGQTGLEGGHLEDLGAFLFSSGEPFVEAAGEELGVEFDQGGFLPDEFQQFAGRHLGQSEAFALFVDGGLDEVVHAYSGDFYRVLEREEYAAVGALFGRETVQVFSQKGDASGRFFKLGIAGDHGREGRFAGTVRAHDGVYFPGAYRQVDAFEDFFAVFHAGFEVFYFKHVRWFLFCVIVPMSGKKGE